MRLLVIAIEFSRDRFSGNGVYGASQVRALAALGHEVMVISGRPAAAAQAEPCREGAARLVEVPLPVWGRLDGGCSWREFAAGAGGEEAVAAAAAFGAQAALGVDWHSAPAFEALAAGLWRAGARPPPFVFTNYRIYLRTAEDGHRDLIYRLEQRALELSVLATVLSQSDAQYLRRHLARPGGPPPPPVRVLLPALRGDMQRLPPPPDVASPGGAAGGDPPRRRQYLACCVRLAPDKGADRFVDLALELQRRGALGRLGATPLMCGAGWGTPFGRWCRERMSAGVPQARLVDSFLGPAELAEVYSQTILNIHPPVYDAFGMTIVEAGSQGAPSLVQGGGHVGATDLLSEAGGEVICCDMGAAISELADQVEALLADRQRLAAVGRAAAAKARSWTEGANATALAALVQAAVCEGGPA